MNSQDLQLEKTDRQAQPPSATVVMLPDQRSPCSSAGFTCTGCVVLNTLIMGLKGCRLGLISMQASRRRTSCAMTPVCVCMRTSMPSKKVLRF